MWVNAEARTETMFLLLQSGSPVEDDGDAGAGIGPGARAPGSSIQHEALPVSANIVAVSLVALSRIYPCGPYVEHK